ncbi:MAG: hypothetical protein JXB85_14330 [Anaerolineales bacterium]|nr:hypothetical protein [Anaerolineales bacterium]
MNRKPLLPLLFALLAALTLGCLCPTASLPWLEPTPTHSPSPSATASPSPSPDPTPTRESNCDSSLRRVLRTGEMGSSTGRRDEFWEDEDVFQLVLYQIDDEQLVVPYLYSVPYDLEIYQDNSDLHQHLWNMFVLFVPPNERQLYTRFLIFTDGPQGALAAAEQTFPNPETWTLKVDIFDVLDEDEVWAVSLTHELGHLVTLNTSQMILLDPGDDCPGFGTFGRCSLPDSYLNQFYDQFWTEIFAEWSDIDALQDSEEYYARLLAFYDEHDDEFVTPYASTSPYEDLAESFTHFIFMPSPDQRTVSDQKILFFYEYPEMVELREYMREQICTYFTSH